MHVENFRMRLTGILLPPKLAAGVITTFVLALSACSSDSSARISAPAFLRDASARSSSATALSLGAASSFAVLSAAPNGGGAVTCTNTPPPTTITGDVGSSGGAASVVNTGCTINGAIVAPVSAQVLLGV
jgi:hypothetical protein